MADVEKLVEAVHADLDTLTDPVILLQRLSTNLTALCALNREQRSAFTPEDTDFLASLKPFEEGLKEFVDYLAAESPADSRQQVSANQVAELDAIIDCLQPYKVAQRAQTIRRAYGERTAPPRAEALEQRKAIAQELARGARPCKCGLPMTVHVNDHVPFWGCTGFPKTCMRRRRLTPAEMARFDAI